MPEGDGTLLDKPQFNHVMVDLETLSTKPNAAIISIGAVTFNPATGELGKTLKVNIQMQSCIDAGLAVDGDTLEWWFKQSKEAQERATQNAVPLLSGLKLFRDFLIYNASTNPHIWGNGSDFDNVILGNAYAATGQKAPWKYSKNRCYRSMKDLAPSIEMKREGVHHDALSDAISQAKHLLAIFAFLDGNRNGALDAIAKDAKEADQCLGLLARYMNSRQHPATWPGMGLTHMVEQAIAIMEADRKDK